MGQPPNFGSTDAIGVPRSCDAGLTQCPGRPPFGRNGCGARVMERREGLSDPVERSSAGSPAILGMSRRTGGFASPPYDGFAFVSIRPDGRGPPIQGRPTPWLFA